MLATGGVDQFVRLWDAETLTNVAVFKGHQSEVWSVAFSPDGETLASASKDGTVKLWKVRPAGAAVKALDTIATPLWFSPDGTVLLTRNRNGSLHYWDVNTALEKRAIPPLKTGSERYFTTVSGDGKYLATSVEDGRIFTWDLESGLPLWTNRVDSNPANALAFSPDNRLLALSAGLYNGGTWNGGTWLLDLGSGRAELLSPDYCGTRDCADLAFARDGKLLAGVGPDYTVRIWDVETRKLRSVLRGPTWHITTMAFSPDGRLLAGGANDNTARLWDVATGAPVAVLTGHKTGIVQLAFTPDGRTLATSGSDRTVRFWNLATYRELMTLKTATTWTHFLFSPNGHALATGGLSGPLELWHAPP